MKGRKTEDEGRMIPHSARPVHNTTKHLNPHGDDILTTHHETAAWEELRRLGEEIGREWKLPQTSAELLSEMRR
jgi:hypothetical protein